MTNQSFSKTGNLNDGETDKLRDLLIKKTSADFTHLDPEAAYFYAQGSLSRLRMDELDNHVPTCDVCLEQFNEVADFIGTANLFETAEAAVSANSPASSAAEKQSWLTGAIEQLQVLANAMLRPVPMFAALVLIAIVGIGGLLIRQNLGNDQLAAVMPVVELTPEMPTPTPKNDNPESITPPSQIDPPDNNKPTPSKSRVTENPVLAKNRKNLVSPVESYNGEIVSKPQPLTAQSGGDNPDTINVSPNALRKEFFVEVEDLPKGGSYTVELNRIPLSGKFAVTARKIKQSRRTGIVVNYNPQEIKGNLVLELKDKKSETIRKFKIIVKNPVPEETNTPNK